MGFYIRFLNISFDVCSFVVNYSCIPLVLLFCRCNWPYGCSASTLNDIELNGIIIIIIIIIIILRSSTSNSRNSSSSDGGSWWY